MFVLKSFISNIPKHNKMPPYLRKYLLPGLRNVQQKKSIPKIQKSSKQKIHKPISKIVSNNQYTQKNIERILDEVPFAGNLFRTKKTHTLSTDKNINKYKFLI